MLRFSCPSCKSVFTAPERKAGTKFDCQKCGQRIQIPGATRNVTVLGKPVEYQPVSSPPPALPQKTSAMLTCPRCKNCFSTATANLGAWINCPKCSEGFLASLEGETELAPPRREPQPAEIHPHFHAGQQAVSVTINAGETAASSLPASLGIGSMFVSVFAFLSCWVPLVGFALGGLGLLLGIVSIIMVSPPFKFGRGHQRKAQALR